MTSHAARTVFDQLMASVGQRHDVRALVRRVERLASDRDRVLIGIAGAPGAGKTTLARALLQELGEDVAAHVPMDGFHLADSALRRLNLAQRKGAPDTFDANGYLALLERLRGAGSTVWAPAFDRDIDQPLAGSIPVGPAVRIVLTEGNYLLLDYQPWARLRHVLDEIWFVEVAEAERVERLVRRHVEFGKTEHAARIWATGSDQRNAELAWAGRAAADVIVSA